MSKGTLWRVDPQRYIRDRVLVAASGCWLWLLATDRGGYGHGHSTGMPRTPFAHRLAYEAFVGPIPCGMTIDHVCHNSDATCAGGDACLHRRCCNPAHLEAVTLRENVLRSPRTIPAIHAAATHCPRGHPYDLSNTGWHQRAGARAYRVCLTCKRHRGGVPA